MKIARPEIYFLFVLAVLAWSGDSSASEPTVPVLTGEVVSAGGPEGRILLAQAPKGSSRNEKAGDRQGFSEAFRWFQKSALKGNKNAQHMLGLMYYDGDGAKRNYGDAKSWFEKAAKQEHDSAQYMLGLIHYYGRGVRKNLAQAEKWFRKAARQGDQDAQYMIGLIIYERAKGRKTKKP